jgi:3-isopropylmalate/(R)-2-methylmalate dehydratase small subunit
VGILAHGSQTAPAGNDFEAVFARQVLVFAWTKGTHEQLPFICQQLCVNGASAISRNEIRAKAMDKFTKLTGVAAPMPIVNVDTDMIIPKDYLKTIKRTGLGSGLFAEMRYKDDGSENPDFVLNKPAYRKAQILVAGDNFGCGSSREHAPWALLDFGIRCVISTSFADIFYNNCFKNGILPITVSPEDLEKLMDDASRGSNATVSVDLEAKEIRGPDGGVVKFDLDDFKRHCLLNGLDDIGLTMEKAGAIASFEKKNAAERPWA